MIQFLDFEFDESQSILFKAGKVIPLNSTQSNLLMLFISNPKKVFSKEDILTSVWHSKVVSEQVVFQNISQLRAILGEDAIKTFPKKGYQWQLELVMIHELKEASKETVNPKESINLSVSQQQGRIEERSNPKITIEPKELHKTLYVRIGVVCLMMVSLLLGGVYFQDLNGFSNLMGERQAQEPVLERTEQTFDGELQFIPFTADSPRHFQSELVTLHTHLDFAFENKSLISREFINSPFMQYQKLNVSNALVFTGILKSNGDSATQKKMPYLLELLVQGQERSWTSYLYGTSMSDLAKQTKTLLSKLSQGDYFVLKSESLLSAELSLMHDSMGESLHALPLLAHQLIQADKFDSASGYIELLLAESELEHPLYYAYGKWLKGQLYQGKRDAVGAQTFYEQADLLFSDAHIYDLQAEVNKSMAELAHSIAHTKEDYDAIHRYLYKAASLARLGKKPVAEIRAYTLLSIKASKFGMKKARMDYLIQAKTLLSEYQLDGSHYMLPTYHFALFAETIEDRIKFYHEVLDKPVTPENYWVFFSSADQLSKLYLQADKPEAALAVIEKITEPARSALLHAQYYRALNNIQSAISYAKRSFNIGRGQHLNWLSLNSALMLLELKQTQGEIHELAEYREFIANHASYWWLNWRKERLATVGIDAEAQMAGL
ncbi:winged helix-turn-helix domain-containing protein [Pseudoalteromonas phenolica]|uniref:OmpR/PhoB-type domain-containing protein n=2 Tax=Pseudoalteromonas phenolica TaxID=161398 RepID=A0A0S2JZV6_9GAMM|nr:winged helix-turn-helix domain-containing protein [Pseudoalteromonas phenolica]ALO41310.1 hypothetical protein PP2015_791 [Pseudoalteromonas phenolica]MBE0354150.1 hypothetical protein [Pseudoalteromonas phenolica O-BC30]